MKQEGNKKILMVFIEPTPYILGLIKAILPIWNAKVDVLFLKENFTQTWALELENTGVVLPNKTIDIARVLYQRIFKGNYGLIYVAGWSQFSCLLCIILSKLVRIPVVVDLDTHLPPALPLWKKILKRAIYPLLFKIPDLFLPGGTKQAKYLTHYGVKSEKIVMAQMTVDVSGIQEYIKSLPSGAREKIRHQLGLQENALVFIFVGRLVAWKGVADLIEAFKKIQRDHAKLLIVGDGPLRPWVEKIALEENNVYYLGRLSGNALIEIYFSADVLVLPSHYEPWGLVVNEAMATGKTVIVSSEVGCVEDLVIHEQTGFVINAKSPESLLKAMIHLYEDPKGRTEMSNNALELISKWTFENEAQIICNAWQKLL